jgi:tetratricopeptide (TPR) repeat protein
MEEHPTPEELLAFVRGELAGAKARKAVLHLVRQCETCVAAAEAQFGEAGYDAALDGALRVVRRTAKQVRKESEAAARVADTLATRGLGGFDDVAATVDRLAIVEGLLQRSRELCHADPRAMVQLAEWAFGESAKLSERKYGTQRVADIRGRAAAELGNAFRVADRLDDAFFYFKQAEELLAKGTGDEMLRVRLLDLQASLAADSRNFSLACNALNFVYKFHLRKGNKHLAGRALIKRGLYIGYAGYPEQAIRITRVGLRLIDQKLDPVLAVAGVHNILWFLVECGQFREARKVLFGHRPSYSQEGSKINLLRLRWLEARIHAGLAELDSAASSLRSVTADFKDVGRGYDSALASLDLAEVLLKRHETVEAREVILEAVDIFKDLGIDREKLMAVLLLRYTIQQGTAAFALAEMLAEVTAFLRRAEHDPNARFEPRLL